MSSFISRLVACLVAVVAILQLVHLVLLNQLESRRLEQLSEIQQQFVPKREKIVEDVVRGRSLKFGSEKDLLMNRLFREDETIVDSTGEYRIIFNIAGPLQTQQITQDKIASSNTDDFSIDDDIEEQYVTLVTQSDLNGGRKHLIPLIEKWNGPMSFVLFANTTNLQSTIEFIAQVRFCSEIVRQYVNFHVVFPLVQTHLRYSSHSDVDIVECNFNGVSQVSFDYPTNLLRNVGRKKVLTDYSFVIPIDMLPSEGLGEKFQRFVKNNGRKSDKTVFVIPAFESKDLVKDKKELLKFNSNYQARPYHFELCWKCQVRTDYDSWTRESGKEKDLSIMYEVLWKDPWEPFFISENSVPLFDEGFRHLTFDRLSQLCELHVAGYKFAVFNEAFLIHEGFITPPPFQVSFSNLDVNRGRFRQFKHEMKNKYPHSTRRCF